MLQTTLCYLEKDGKYLMLHRTAKDKDINKDKWIGVGGKFEPGETPEECLLREVYEETGLTLESYRFRGILTFRCDGAEEYIFLYTADRFSGTLRECDEGELCWVDIEAVNGLNLWEGDRRMFALLKEQTAPFSLKLCYENGRLVSCTDSLMTTEDGTNKNTPQKC